MRTRLPGCVLPSIAILTAFALQSPAQDDDFRNGLHAKYRAGKRTVERIDADIAFDWGTASPDPRLPTVEFSAEWTGTLLVKKSAAYRFHAHVAGDVTIAIDGNAVLTSNRDAAGWVHGKPVDLRAGLRKLRVRFGRTGKTARVQLFWSAERFSLEPLPARLLFHEAPQKLERVETGRVLFDAHRCNRCHRRANDPPNLPGPDLTHVAAGLNAAEMTAKIRDPRHNAPQAKMPSFGFTQKEAAAIAAFLRSVSKPVKLAALPKLKRKRPRKKGKYDVPKKPLSERRSGEVLFRSVGCLACHAIGKEGHTGPYGGGDLSNVGAKRTAKWLYHWLNDPASLNADHRMPVFKLSTRERKELAVYLSSVRKKASGGRKPPEGAERLNDIALGKKLVEQSRCAACHTIPGVTFKPANIPDLSLRAPGRKSTCLQATPDRRKHRPAYPTINAAAVTAFLASRPAKLSPLSAFDRGRFVLERRNCTGCHPRGQSEGIVETAGRMAKLDAELRGQSQGLIPPSLNAVGDKLLDEYLKTAVAGEQKTVRLPWLRVRMPRFRHTKAESSALVSYLKAHDRIPGGFESAAKRQAGLTADSQVLVAGQTLLGVRGFSCIACHTVGDYEPRNVALGTRGSDLMHVAKRLRKAFFDRWTRNPIRIVPGMEMPSYHAKPVPGVLKNDVDLQLAVLWQALNDPRFKPPTNPSVVEQFVTVKPGEPARIIRDVFTVPKENGGGYVARSLAIGLNNGHNLLFDLDTYSLRGWFFGDFARQRTQGKSWYWDMAGVPVMTGLKSGPDIILVKKDKKTGKETVYLPKRVDGSVGRLVGYSRDLGHFPTDGLKWQYTLRFEIEHRQFEFHFTDAVIPVKSFPESKSSGVVRMVVAEGVSTAGTIRNPKPLPGDITVYVARPVPASRIAGARIEDQSSDFSTIKDTKWRRFKFAPNREYAAFDNDIPLGDKRNAGRGIVLGYRSTLTGERSKVTLTPKPKSVRPEELTVVPGFRGIRIPISRSIMPTAIAWTAFGKLVFTSLKGHVFVATDTNDDGDEDHLRILANGLAAPYGIIASKQGLIVSHKPELLRLSPFDRSHGENYRQVLATGWGYTDNYHDWTCGIVRDRKGNLYVGLGSDYAQPKRPKEHALWRGKVLRISPKGKITPVGHAFRYPTGLAMNDAGDIFVSDNQGVQNTFNEINHLQEGKHYGVPSRFEENRNAPTTPPAIQVPHPWTRSVNGIFFLPKEPPKRRQASRERERPEGREATVTRTALHGRDTSRAAATAIGPGRTPREPRAHDIGKPRRGSSSDAIATDECRPSGASHSPPHEYLGLPPQANRCRPSGTAPRDAGNRRVGGITDDATPVAHAPGSPRKSYFVKAFAGHGIGCEYDNRFLIRFSLQKVDGVYQGACYAFSKPNAGRGKTNFLGPLCGGVAPDGAIYIGSIYDSGWLGGPNTGDIVRLVPNGKLPNGIRELRVTKDGFEIEFIKPVDRAAASKPENYAISGYTRVWKGSYATPDSGRHTLTVKAVYVSKDNKTVRLTVPNRRAGRYVYDVTCGKIGTKDQPELWPATGHYTLHRIPK